MLLNQNDTQMDVIVEASRMAREEKELWRRSRGKLSSTDELCWMVASIEKSDDLHDL